jgi:3-isopropylmalate/(R)-2-methylmalate dehydratase small subunit
MPQPKAKKKWHTILNILTSNAVPLPIENVDTDQIIPARFLKATERKGFGDNLLETGDNSDDTPKADFVLNDTTYSGKILVGGKTLVWFP